MSRRLITVLVLALVAAAWVLSDTVFVVSETRQALIVTLEGPVVAVSEPGLHWKRPFVDQLISFDRRLLPLPLPIEQIILGDQKRLEVQSYALYRISDPLRYYQSLRTVEQGSMQLAQIVSSSTRRELGQVNLPTLLSAGREKVIQNIRREVATRAAPLGVDILEVRIRRADLPPETSQSVYDRMKSERQREAKELRAQGFEWAQQIQARADRDRTVLLAEATRTSKITVGEGDAAAAKIFAAAFADEPVFYQFYRSLMTYRQSLAEAQPMLVLSPNSEFLRTLTGGPKPAKN
ncbi:MAG: protease modulator HflC [Ancalomicrobiaceae bacterium]|nr:protease modulator HflC [Ancalomicrobiaceae bacterium]